MMMTPQRKVKKPQIQTFRIAILGPGNLIGEEDVINDYEEGMTCYYSTSVRCISINADIFCIKVEEFMRKFKINRDSWSSIIDTANNKE